MFSKKETKVRCVHEDLVPYRHVANDAWYYKKGEHIVFNFILADDTNMLKNITHQLIVLDTVNLSKNLTLVKTQDFFFNENFELVKKN